MYPAHHRQVADGDLPSRVHRSSHELAASHKLERFEGERREGRKSAEQADEQEQPAWRERHLVLYVTTVWRALS